MDTQRADPYRLVYEHLPTGVLVADLTGRLVAANRVARALLGPALRRDAVRCCDVFGCRRPGTPLADACVTTAALAGDAPTDEVRVEAPLDDRTTASVWLTASTVGATAAVVLQVRPAPPGDRRRRTQRGWQAGATLRVHALGRTRLELGAVPLAGEWLAHRPGELLKYLVVARGRIVTIEELLDAFWEGGERGSATNVRQAVHTLRTRLEPLREPHRPSSFVLARRGGYELDAERVWIDADELVAVAGVAADALARGDAIAAETALARAAALYGGEFLRDEPYADWAIAERERLRAVAARALRSLTRLRLARGDHEGALEALRRHVAIDPSDDRPRADLLGLLARRADPEPPRRRFRSLPADALGWELGDVGLAGAAG